MNVQIGVVVTQILGFLIIFLIMKKFAWGPILSLLDERRDKIRDSFADIERQKVEAAALKTQYEGELKKIDAQARQRITEALAEAQKMAQDIEASARERSRAELEKLKGEIEREYQSARVRLKEDIVNVALASAERMVRENLDRDRQRKLVEGFLAELESGPAGRKG